MRYAKGILTQQRIISVSKHLFYERGYKKVTLRRISMESEVNLGLLNYYFNGKGHLGMTIYMEVRKAMNAELTRCFPNRMGVEYFLLSSAAELMLCLHSRQYGEFYLNMSKEPQFKKDVNETIIDTILKYSQDNRSDHAVLSSLSIMATKPALVEHFYAYPGIIGHDDYLRYYLEMQIYHLNIGNGKRDELLAAIHSVSFSMMDDFEPVIQPVAAGGE